LACVVALLACSRQPKPIVKGSDVPPAEFGALQKDRSDCPNLEGLYAWPWAQGQPFGYRTPTQRDKFGDFLGMSLEAESQVWVSGPAGTNPEELTLRTRMVNRNPNMRIGSLTTEWGYQIFNRLEFRCEDGWAELPEVDLQGDSVAYWYGGRGAKVSARLGLMADGSLAVGQKLRVWGRGNAGNNTVATINAKYGPDKITWYWTRLSRIGPTGKDAPPDDAALR
jgi:hypothetical protein